MSFMNKPPELLAPAGDLEKLKIALNYGADAVYIGGKSLGLRARAKNFEEDEMREGIRYAHSMGKKVYVTLNIFARNEDFIGLEEYASKLYEIEADAVIVSDPGIFSVVRKTVPELEIHISTQANNTNYRSAMFWRELGAKRVIAARELPLEEIAEIRRMLPGDFEIESFVHGAMCISYSGRCLLSNYMSGRDANKGECSQPCRWNYSLVEEKRPGEYYPAFEDEKGTYIFNSKDLCLVTHVGELIEAGINSFKIEGRMKTSHYVGTVVKAYREAIDDFYAGKNRDYISEVSKASNREFTTGFYFGNPEQNTIVSKSRRTYDFVGLILGYDKVSKLARIEQRNKFTAGEEIEFLTKKGDGFTQIIDEIYAEDGKKLSEAPHPQQILFVRVQNEIGLFDMMRRKNN